MNDKISSASLRHAISSSDENGSSDIKIGADTKRKSTKVKKKQICKKFDQYNDSFRSSEDDGEKEKLINEKQKENEVDQNKKEKYN